MLEALRKLWRFLIWGLAALFAVALYLNFSGKSDDTEVAVIVPEPVAVTPVAPEPEAEVAAPETEAAEVEKAETVVVEASENDPVSQEAEAEAEATETPDQLTVIDVPADSGALYSLVDLLTREDGMIELTTLREEGDSNAYATRLIQCDPRLFGFVARGQTPVGLIRRTQNPTMVAINEGSSAASLADFACGDG